jgi:hypothetical protein
MLLKRRGVGWVLQDGEEKRCPATDLHQGLSDWSSASIEDRVILDVQEQGTQLRVLLRVDSQAGDAVCCLTVIQVDKMLGGMSG